MSFYRFKILVPSISYVLITNLELYKILAKLENTLSPKKGIIKNAL